MYCMSKPYDVRYFNLCIVCLNPFLCYLYRVFLFGSSHRFIIIICTPLCIYRTIKEHKSHQWPCFISLHACAATKWCPDPFVCIVERIVGVRYHHPSRRREWSHDRLIIRRREHLISSLFVSWSFIIVNIITSHKTVFVATHSSSRDVHHRLVESSCTAMFTCE